MLSEIPWTYYIYKCFFEVSESRGVGIRRNKTKWIAKTSAFGLQVLD